MAKTNNVGKLIDGPIGFLSMGPIADRPTTAKLNDVYISTDEANGKWKIYWWDDTISGNVNGWNLFKGVSMS